MRQLPDAGTAASVRGQDRTQPGSSNRYNRGGESMARDSVVSATGSSTAAPMRTLAACTQACLHPVPTCTGSGSNRML